MHSSQTDSRYLKTKTQTDLTLYNSINFFSKLYNREREKYESLDMKNILDGKEFWKTMRSFLSDKFFLQISIE